MAISLRAVVTNARSSAIPPAAARPSVAGVIALGRIEARKIVLHPSFLIGMAFGFFVLRGFSGGGDVDGLTLRQNVQWLVAGALAGLVIGAVLSTNLAALRPRRSNVLEMFGALPAPRETGTAGVFAGLVLGPVLLAVGLTAVGWWAFRDDPDIGPHLDLFLAIQLPLTVAALGALAIAVGRWIPSVLGGPIVIVLHLFTPLLWAVPWVVPRSELDPAPWHLVYLLAVIATWTAVALLRDRRTFWRIAVAVGAFAIGLTAAFQQVPEGGW